MKEIILLTGATGFLGSHLLEGFIKSNKYKVIVLKRSFSNLARIEHIISENIKYYDIDKINVEEIFKGNKIDIIVHTAINYGKKKESVFEILETNLMFPIKLVELGITNNVKCFINTDSYINKEKFSYQHLLNYSLSKKSFWAWLKYLSKEIQIVNMVLEHVYGGRDSASKFVESMIQKIAIEEIDSVDLTYGDQKRDFIYVADVVEACLKIVDFCLNNKFHYKVFEVGTGKSIGIKEFVNKIKLLSNSKTLLNFGKLPYRADEIMDSMADIQELENLNWKSRVSVDEGLGNIINYYKARKNI